MFKKEWTKEEIDFLKNNYLKMTNKEIGEKINRTTHAVQIKLSKLGWKRPEQYYYDKDFFKEINTEEKAYWLGFLYADGYVCLNKKNGNSEVGIELSAIDIDHLRKFNKSIHGNVEPIIRKERKTNMDSKNGIASFRLYCTSMVKDLINQGCVQNKTFLISFPKFSSKEIMWTFIRGFFDGDGCIYKDKNRNFIGFNFTSGSKKFLEGLQKFLYEEKIYAYLSEENRKDNKFKHSHTTYKLTITGMNNAYIFGQKLYKNASIYLDRKKNKYETALEEYDIVNRTKNRPYRR